MCVKDQSRTRSYMCLRSVQNKVIHVPRSVQNKVIHVSKIADLNMTKCSYKKLITSILFQETALAMYCWYH